MLGTCYPTFFSSDVQVAATGIFAISGFLISETAGATAVVKVYDALTATGNPIIRVNLAANETAGANFIPPIRINVGVYIDIVSGAVEGNLRCS